MTFMVNIKKIKQVESSLKLFDIGSSRICVGNYNRLMLASLRCSLSNES